MAICIFPGTFNPIHQAHIKMAEFVLQNFDVEKVIFIPSYIPPHKNIDKTIAFHRLNMVKLAVQGNPNFEVSDIEYKSGGKSGGKKSYTLITVKKIREKYNIEGKLNMLIGTDAFSQIRSWYKVDELKELVHFIVFPRETNVINRNEFSDFDFEIVKAEEINLSSTELRNGLKTGLNKEVEDYIKEHELYGRLYK